MKGTEMKAVKVQQGDLLLVADKLPDAAKKINTGARFTALRGEGVNTHDVVGAFSAYEDADGTLFLVVENAKLIHAEHGTETLPSGTFRRVIEREFDYEAMEGRKVED